MFCHECYLKATQLPSQATLALDREVRLQSEVRCLAESETCAGQRPLGTEDEAQIEAEKKERERAEIHHEVLEVAAEATAQSEEL